ncbi:adenosine deaminase [Propionicimonas paludicola]|uniref:Adenine deaminase n=1 Tax=Propionicimonas paludicola TaxID=185243 RepID=A0A2A9CUT3_9ACTN|nr:adenosine deaminase [Propionicimonas paludicola]PFG18158.1 adenosine deaminase [Propionicimonas paludicola]
MGFAELHLHLEGTLEPELAFELAERNQLTLPWRDVDDLRSRFDYGCLQDFLDIYYANMAVLRTEADFAELTDAYLARAARAGVVRAEVFLDLQAHTARGVPAEVVLAGVSDALSRSEVDHGVSSGLIVTFLRHLSADDAECAYDQALATGVELLGIGLCSSEVGFPAAPFAPLWQRARADGLHTVAHAGEEGGPDYVWEALRELKVERVDHGIRAVEDPSLVAHLAEQRIPLTSCPLSNVRLKAVPHLAAHPLPAMLDAGLLVTVNSDDPAYFGGYLDDNLVAVRDQFGLRQDQLDTLACNSIEASFLPAAEKARLLAVG